MPIIAVLLVVGVFFYQITSRLNGSSAFATGTFIGLAVVLSAVSIIGFILFLLSMHRLSKYYNEPSIFKNVLYAFIISIISGVIILIIDLGFIVTAANNFAQLGTTASASAVFAQFILGFAAVFVIGLVSSIINAVLYWRAFTKLGEKSGVEGFKTTGLLYLIGVVLTIIFVGVIIVWVAWIYAAESFKKLQPQPTTITSTYIPPTAPPSSGKIYCSYCGTENDTNAIYCKHCGKTLQTSQASV
jgi:uncharacterized membrane protein